MYPLTRAERHYLAHAHFHPAPDRGRSIADGQRDQDRIRRHRNKSDPRELLFASYQAHVVQHDLRQPCAEPPRAGDQQAEDAVLAQRRLKILRIAENRRDAVWHLALSKPAWLWLPFRDCAEAAHSRYPISAETCRRLATCSPSVAARGRLPDRAFHSRQGR